MTYQDFELPIDDSNNLVAKILQYAGISIREADVFQFGQLEEQQQNQTEYLIMAYINQRKYYTNDGVNPTDQIGALISMLL